MSFAVFLVTLSLVSPLASAKLGPWADRSQLEPKSIDLAAAPTQARKLPPGIKSLAKAADALQKENWSAAKQFARAALSDRSAADIALVVLARAQLKDAEQLLAKKRWAEVDTQATQAIELWLRVLQKYPYAPGLKTLPDEIGRAEVFAGRSRSARGQHVSAIELFDRGFQRLLVGGKLSLVGVDEIRAFATSCAKAETLGCRSWTQRLLNLSPKESPEYIVLKEKFPEQAALQRPSWTGSKLTQTYKAPDPDQEAFDLAFEVLLSGKNAQAAREFQKFLDEYPRSQHRHRARFWLGQAYSHQNEHERATRAYEQIIRDAPLSFHGLLASFVTGVTPETAISATLPFVVEFDVNTQPADLLHFDRAIALLSSGAKELAAGELREFRVRENLSNAFLFYLAWASHESGAHLSAFSAITELVNRGADGIYTSRILPWVFPVEKYDLIQKHAQAVGIDPILVLSLIKQESAFESGIASGVGAQGLMQLMPATAVDTDPTVQRARLTDPDTNIRVGTLYLKKMLTRFGGNVAFALAAYNAGPGAVDRWIRDNRAKRGLLEFIEQIPYRETRDYVGSIIRNYYWYSKQLSQEPLRDLDRFFAQVERLPEPAAIPSPEPAPKATPIPEVLEPQPQPQPGG